MASAQPSSGTREGSDRAILADLIDACRDDIVARWLKRVETELGKSVGTAQLQNAMPDYLAGLSAALRGTGGLPQRGAAAWVDVAREHALTRVRLGFDIDELVREFILLRQVLAEVSRERQANLDIPQAERVADLIEAAISVSVRSYVEARDYAARQREARRISFVTHELRNPLSAAKLAASRLRRSAARYDEHSFDVLERNLGRLESLIDGVLNVERFQADKVQPHPEEVELCELLDRPLATAKMAAEVKGLTVTAEYDPHVLVRADPELAMSAISNVLDNAVKYTDAGEVRVGAEPSADRVTVHVWDNCPGLSEEELGVIFEPFERGQSKKPGSGLGLAIARRALEAQGGSIDAESKGERGCHFWLALPRAAH